MTQALLTEPGQADSDWLTAALTANGHLRRGRATQVTHEVLKQARIVDVVRLHTHYSSDAVFGSGGAPPPRLILKLSRAGDAIKRNVLFARREFEFYTQIAATMTRTLTVRCFHAASSLNSDKHQFLLEDLSLTHRHTSHPLPPTIPECEQIMECLAQFQAAWWNHARLGVDIGRPFLKERRSRRAARIQRHTGELLAFLGDRMSGSRREAMRDASAFYPQVLERQNASPLTITHGDAHYGNFMVAPDQADCRIIDWENWEVGPATDDLSYMMAIFWFPERRQRLEQDLLRRYHRILLQCGVRDYAWENLWDDYRLSVIKHLCTPANQWADGKFSTSWWNNLERRLAAYEDLNCAEIMAQLKRP